jgi:hypothetical protein
MQLCIYVCEILARDYEKVISNEGFTDVIIKKYPSFCINKNLDIKKYQQLFVKQEEQDHVIVCGNQCQCLKLDGIKEFAYDIISSDYCYSYLTGDKFPETIINDGGYIVTTGWLKKWRYILEKEKFNQEVAQQFYSEFCCEIVLLILISPL